jgi:hypothetical protein
MNGGASNHEGAAGWRPNRHFCVILAPCRRSSTAICGSDPSMCSSIRRSRSGGRSSRMGTATMRAERTRRGAGDTGHDRHHEGALRRGLRRRVPGARLRHAARRRRGDGDVLPRRAHSRFGAGADGASGPADRRHRRLQARARCDGAAVRAGDVRPAGHRGNLRAAGVPASRSDERDAAAAALGARAPGARACHRLLRAGQGAAGDRVAAAGRLRRADLPAWRDGAVVCALRGTRHSAGRAEALARHSQGPAQGADRHRAALGDQGSLEPAAARSGAGRRLGLDERQAAGAAIGRRAAAGDLRSRRLERAAQTIEETGAETVWVTHGREDAIVYWCRQQGLISEPLRIVAYEEDGEDED